MRGAIGLAAECIDDMEDAPENPNGLSVLPGYPKRSWVLTDVSGTARMTSHSGSPEVL
jgi:hypothetical protein